jgi:pyrroline-5-carboxylate reductase
MKIAFVGTGVMGQGMVANLLKAGHEVTVYTRTKSKADGLLALGSKWASSPAESARGGPTTGVISRSCRPTPAAFVRRCCGPSVRQVMMWRLRWRH